MVNLPSSPETSCSNPTVVISSSWLDLQLVARACGEYPLSPTSLGVAQFSQANEVPSEQAAKGHQEKDSQKQLQIVVPAHVGTRRHKMALNEEPRLEKVISIHFAAPHLTHLTDTATSGAPRKILAAMSQNPPPESLHLQRLQPHVPGVLHRLGV